MEKLQKDGISPQTKPGCLLRICRLIRLVRRFRTVTHRMEIAQQQELELNTHALGQKRGMFGTMETIPPSQISFISTITKMTHFLVLMQG